MKQELTVENHLSETEARWFAVRTRFRSEKLAAKSLETQNIEFYLPLKKSVKIYGRLKRETELPLIPSFVFVHIVRKQYVSVLESNYAAGFLKIGNSLLAIKDEEIDFLKRLTDLPNDIAVEENGAGIGDLVEVAYGPLIGLQGKLIQFENKSRVAVSLFNSGVVLSISIEQKFLKKII